MKLFAILFLTFLTTITNAFCLKSENHDKEMELIQNNYSPKLEFEGKYIPIPFKYNISSSVDRNFYAYSDYCIDDRAGRQLIKVKIIENCLLCRASDEELNLESIEVIERKLINGVTVLQAERNNRFLLEVWSTSSSLLVIDRNLKYIEYVRDLFTKQ